MDSIGIGIIELLIQKNDFTSEQLGKVLSVSERTIRNRIKEINEMVIKHGAVIVSQRGQGFHLEIINKDIFEKWLESIREENNSVPNSPEERVNYLIDYLLNQKDYVLIDDLSDLLYVARNTLTLDLKRVEQIIYKYNLSIERRPNYGIHISGKEADKRLCIVDYLIRNNSYLVSKLKNVSEMMELGDALSNEFHLGEFSTTVENYTTIKRISYVAYKRAKNGFQLNFSSDYRNRITNSLSANIMDLVERIICRLGGRYQILNDPDEKLYLAMQIAGRGNIISGAKTEINPDIDEIVMGMLAEVKNGLKVDLTSDFDLLMALRNHMTAFDIRMKYYISINNPILETVKKKYSLAYALASYACNFLSERYDKNISEDEIGYVAIIFEMALEKKNKPVKKKNVVIVCPSGSSTSRFFMYKYKEVFGEYLADVYECSASDIETFDFKGKKIDYCFTTLNITFQIPVPCYKISILPSENEIKKYLELFDRDNYKYLSSYYSPHLFIPSLSCANKEEALRKMVQWISERKKLPIDFLDMVLKREKHGLTSFGNLAATPHPIKTCTEENVVCVAVLDKPINWGNNDVQVIILLSLSLDDQQDSRIFIQTLTDFISNEKAVEQLIRERTYENFMQLLTQDNGCR